MHLLEHNTIKIGHNGKTKIAEVTNIWKNKYTLLNIIYIKEKIITYNIQFVERNENNIP